jgi:hypothetical protein
MPHLLIAVPVIFLAALAHSILHVYAPSNILIRHVRASSRPTLRMAIRLGVLAFGCALAVHGVNGAIQAGAPAWLNLVVLVLAWDAIKFAVMACLTSLHRLSRASPPHGRPVHPWFTRLDESRRESNRLRESSHGA